MNKIFKDEISRVTVGTFLLFTGSVALLWMNWQIFIAVVLIIGGQKIIGNDRRS